MNASRGKSIADERLRKSLIRSALGAARSVSESLAVDLLQGLRRDLDLLRLGAGRLRHDNGEHAVLEVSCNLLSLDIAALVTA